MPDSELTWPRPLLLLTSLLARRDDSAEKLASGLNAADWQEFEGLVTRRHRVAPAVLAELERSRMLVPERTYAAIRAEARANGFAALAQKAEALRLAADLTGAGVRAVWLKGWPLAEQLYGATGHRHASDIDFLVAPSERLEAARLLAEAGYVPAAEHALRAVLIRKQAVCSECKDIQYIHPDSGLVVELHWRTSHFRGWPEFGDIGEPPVVLPGIDGPEILVPGPLEQLVYLSGHGMQHLFGRLKWLLDIARLADQRGPKALAEDLARAEAAGAGRAVRLSLNLAWRVFGAEIPGAAHRLGGAESRWADEILSDIGDPRAEPGRPRARLGFYRWHLRLAESPAQVGGVLRYAIWRRLRLGLAMLTLPVGSGGA